MVKAISDWLNKTPEGDRSDNNGERVDNICMYAFVVGIPYKNLYRYITPNIDKRQELGDGARGSTKLLTDGDVRFIGEVWARDDRGNDGLSRKEAIDNIQELNHTITRESASRQLFRCILPDNAKSGILKPLSQKVQATTSDRTKINVAQQYRWHSLVDDIYKQMSEKNTGVCAVTGKTFGEVMPHYVVGLDEMCLMGDVHGSCGIIGSMDKKKLEKLLQDGRVSVTVIRTRTVGRSTGPTILLLKGEKKRKHFANDFLVKHGCAPGSTIIMTENAYMTDEAWEEASTAIVSGYRKIPHVHNPEWLMLEFLDGFKSHENVLRAHEFRADNSIISLKEESNTSHANQAYDQHVAKFDKNNGAETLYDQRNLSKWKTRKTTIT